MPDDETRAIDAVLHLLDRQVVDRDGLMVCKVDDLELTEHQDGTWEVTALLAGPPVLVPRLGGRLGAGLERWWRRLGVQQADRLVPYRIGISLVAELGSGVRLLAARDAVLQRQTQAPPSPGDIRRTLNDLLQLEARTADDQPVGQVLDLRLLRASTEPLRLVAQGIQVGPGRPGGNLGYDRNDEQGPWLIRRAVQWLQRHSGYVPIGELQHVDWSEGTVTLKASPQPLEHA